MSKETHECNYVLGHVSTDLLNFASIIKKKGIYSHLKCMYSISLKISSCKSVTALSLTFTVVLITSGFRVVPHGQQQAAGRCDLN